MVFLSPFVGSLIGTYFCGRFADMVANWYTKRNGGVREPEMRLPTCLLAAVLMFLGAVMAGLTYKYKTHWIGPIVGFGVLSTGAQMGATLAMSYSLDCHKEVSLVSGSRDDLSVCLPGLSQLSVELMVTISVLKSLIAWIWTWVINDWVAASGTLTVFLVIGAVNLAAYLTTFLLYFYGKGIRMRIHEYQIFEKLGLQ